MIKKNINFEDIPETNQKFWKDCLIVNKSNEKQQMKQFTSEQQKKALKYMLSKNKGEISITNKDRPIALMAAINLRDLAFNQGIAVTITGDNANQQHNKDYKPLVFIEFEKS